MNDFINKQPNKRPRYSIDGVSTGRSPHFNRPQSKVGFGDSSAKSQPKPPSSIGDFKRPEGFHAAKRDEIRMPKIDESPKNELREPIVIDRTPPKKMGFWSRRKARKAGLDGMGRKHKRPLSRKQKIIRGLAVFFVIVFAIVGFLAAKGYINLHKVLRGGGGAAALQENVDPSKLKGEGDGRVNILMMGRGGEGHDGADLTDTIILVSIDPIAKEAALVSIPRDLYVAVPKYGSMKINQVFYTGKEAYLSKNKKITEDVKRQAEDAGFSLMEDQIQQTLGVPVHYHVMIDFSGFKQAIDTVGGIDLNAPAAVAEQMRIDGKNYYLNIKPGQQHMDGFTALAYARSRHTSPRGDFDRAERQRLMIVALKEKVLSLGTFGNPQKISQLIGNFGNHVVTNFSVQDMKRLYDLSKDIGGDKIVSLGLADPPNPLLTTGNIGGLSVVLPTAGQGNFKPLQEFLRSALKDSYLKSENAGVMILNGTQTPGLATAKSDELKSYGYNVLGVNNAPTKDYTKTVIADLRNGQKKYTKNYLEKRFGVSATNALPDPTIQPGNADFVIIIGSDQTAQ